VAENLDALEKQWQNAESECTKGIGELAEMRGALEAKGSAGIDSQLAEAGQRYQVLSETCEELDRDAAAWAILYHLMAEVEQEQSQNVASRLARCSAEGIARLTGGTITSVRAHPTTLGLEKATLASEHFEVALERLSRGTREQIALACRLALGALLSQEERQMLLLDDPLAHTDPARHREALALLLEASQQFQVIIFTCHRDRYISLINDVSANWIDIHSLCGKPHATDTWELENSPATDEISYHYEEAP
jgi:uncharacterized protein YhaN